MNLILDQGNTFIKAALFHNDQLKQKARWPQLQAETLREFVGIKEVKASIWSSTREEAPHWLFEMGFPILKFNSLTPLPFTSNYNTPSTLGLDRLALAAAAYHTYPGQDCLVIDAGTAITYDFIDRSGLYRGGAIAPGLSMRFRALHEYTARLPLVEADSEVPLIGDSTETAIRSGVQNGLLHEVSATIDRYQQRFPDLLSVITGGDLSTFDSLLKNGIFAAPDFVLHGLNYILEYHAEKI